VITDLILPKRGIESLELPSYVKLDMAFGLGSGSTLFDKSRYQSHGTISGASWAAGLHGKALDFVIASKDYVEIPASYTQLNFTSEDFSIVIRIKFDLETAASRTIFVRGLLNTDGWWLYHYSTYVWFRTNQAAANQLTRSTSGTFPSNVWKTLGLSRSGTSVIIYSDGVDVNTVVGVHTNPATSARTAKVGVYDDKIVNHLDGKIEFLRIIGGVALTASEHLAYHNALK